MKNYGSGLVKLTLGVLLAVTVAACNKSNTSEKATATVATGTEAGKGAIVFVNQDTLLSQYTYFKDMTARLEAKGKTAQADLQSKGQAFQREVAEYQKNAQTMAADVRATTEKHLQSKNQELQAYQQNAGAQVQNDQAAEQLKLYERISDYVKKYAKDKGYKMVLTYSKGNSAILFADETLDVTSPVLVGLNEAYLKDKK